MKFGKRLRMQIEETLPEWRNQFLSYKELKKRLKSLAAPECFTEAACETSQNPEEDSSFAAAPAGAWADSAGAMAPADAGAVSSGEAENLGLGLPHALLRKGSDEAVRDEGFSAEDSHGRLASVEIGFRDEGSREGAERRHLKPEAAAIAGLNEDESNSGDDGVVQEGVFVSGLRVAPQASSPGGMIEEGSHLQLRMAAGRYPGEFRFSLKDTPGRPITKEEEEFILLLNGELEKFNSFFIEKEEEYVIRLQELKEKIDAVCIESGGRLVFRGTECTEEVMAIRREIVAFHGEMVLLENYSSVNYMGIVKILKKHDKRMGTVLRLPFIQTVLHQPFYTTELLGKLVRECEEKLQLVFPPALEGEGEGSAEEAQRGSCGDNGETGNEGDAGRAVEDCGNSSPAVRQASDDEELRVALPRGEDVACIYRSTLAALKTLQEMRGNIEAAATASRDGEEGNGSGVSSLTKAGDGKEAGDGLRMVTKESEDRAEGAARDDIGGSGEEEAQGATN